MSNKYIVKCCVPNCISEVQTRFGIPKNSLICWEKVIGIALNSNSKICSSHFEREDVVDTWESGSGTNKYSICLKKPRLKPGAIPKLFLNKKDCLLESTMSSSHIKDHSYSITEAKVSNIENLNFESRSSNASNNINLLSSDITSEIQDHNMEWMPYISDNVFDENVSLNNILLNIQKNVKLPSKWFSDITYHKGFKTLTFFKMGRFNDNFQRLIEKQLIVNTASDILIHILNNKLSIEEQKLFYPHEHITEINTEVISNILMVLDSMNVCYGAALVSKFPNIKTAYASQFEIVNDYWKHVNCSKIITDNSTMCLMCKRLLYSLKKKKTRISVGKQVRLYFSPNKKNTLNKLKQSKILARQQAVRAKNKIVKLQCELNDVKQKMKNMSDSSLLNIINNSKFTKIQSELLQQIFTAAKMKNPKNRRYSENWMLLCLLFQIRSPSGYKFLKDQNVLPLPCTSTIRRHLLAVKGECGFDNSFFKLLKKKKLSKTTSQKKGILLIDEIFLRTSLSVNSRNLTYNGLEDFGNEIESKTGSSELADHGLVFMWQSLADNITQPVAVFASKGPVKGVNLAQLVLKAILLIEDAGLQVLGLTSDGASTNKTMFNILGLCGDMSNLKNYFENPFDSNRKVFVFCDAPHTIKNIRNRLVQNKQLKIHPLKNYIKWEHYCHVFENDAKSTLKICPKITKNHIDLNNLAKMKVKYATQLFSKSMAVGIQFYREQKCDGLKDSIDTQHFTVTINDMFDALNRKFPAEGIKKNSQDLEVLKQSLEWLDEWQTCVSSGQIKEQEFLTKNTAESLRITLKSTIDLVLYLLNECDFKYVLTYKFNQDALEKFFGIIRQSSGPNDHPSTPTFLQLYRLLSVYSLIKPPKTGNCSLSENSNYEPLINISDLKAAIKENKTEIRDQKIFKLKQYLDNVVEEGQWDVDDIFKNNDLTDDITFECVVYYLAGYLARKLSKKTNCDVCLAGIKNLNNSSNMHVALLVNLKSRGYLIHPESNFYVLIRLIEMSFIKYADSQNVFEETIDDFFNSNYVIPFPCNEHKSEVVEYIFTSYITMRMRQHTYYSNHKEKSKNQVKKKLSKLVSK